MFMCCSRDTSLYTAEPSLANRTTFSKLTLESSVRMRLVLPRDYASNVDTANRNKNELTERFFALSTLP